MSMKSYGCHGYVEKAEELKKLLPIKVRGKYQDALDDFCMEDCLSILQEHLPKRFASPRNCIGLTDEDDSEDLEIGVLYAYWDESDLYEKVETQGMKNLKTMDVVPIASTWVCWG